MPAFQTIVYVSSATWDLADNDLETLLIEARALNLENAVTGILLYSEGNFMQCLEGPALAVQETMIRILASSKHKDILILLKEAVDHRCFPDWQMGFAQATRSDLLALSTASWESIVSQAPERGFRPPGLVLLSNFWKHARH